MSRIVPILEDLGLCSQHAIEVPNLLKQDKTKLATSQVLYSTTISDDDKMSSVTQHGFG